MKLFTFYQVAQSPSVLETGNINSDDNGNLPVQLEAQTEAVAENTSTNEPNSSAHVFSENQDIASPSHEVCKSYNWTISDIPISDFYDFSFEF